MERDDYGLNGQDELSSSSSSTDDEDDQGRTDLKTHHPDEADPDELIRAYEGELENWKPWWRNANLAITEIDESVNEKLTSSSQSQASNKRLEANSAAVNVSNANQFFYYEIMQTSYLYIILAYVYQLDERDLEALANSESSSDGEVDLSLVDEMCFAFLQVQKLLAQSTKNLTDLAARFELAIATLLQEENYFLKVTMIYLLNIEL